MAERRTPQFKEIDRAFDALLRPYMFFPSIIAEAEIVEIDPAWRTELLDSESEVRIAQALNRAGVLFLANCRARLGFGRDRENREADFLVVHRGLLGILEVDGEPFHAPSRTVHNHERDACSKPMACA